nr:hypothetical protein [Methanofollis formosanus]
MDLFVEVVCHPRNRRRRELIDPQMSNDFLDPASLNTLKMRFRDRIHKNFLNLGITSKYLGFEGKFTKLRFLEISIPGF